MAIPSNVAAQVACKTEELVYSAKNLRNQVSPSKFIEIRLALGSYQILKDQCRNVDEKSRGRIEFLLRSAQRKLELADKTVQFILTNDETSVNPRVTDIREKILANQSGLRDTYQLPTGTVETQCALVINKKLSRYSKKLEEISSQRANPPTKEAIVEASSVLKQLREELTQTPQIIVFGHSLQRPIPHHSSNVDLINNSHEWKKMACAPYAKLYLEKVLNAEDLIANIDRRSWETGIMEEQCNAYSWAFMYKKNNELSSRISVEDLFLECNQGLLGQVHPQKLAPVTKKPLSFPPGADEGAIQQQIESLIELKKTHQFNCMGVFVEIGPQTSALVLHGSGRIFFFNPSGEKATSYFCYEVDFGNSKQVAAFLKKLTAEIGPTSDITLVPYRYLKD